MKVQGKGTNRACIQMLYLLEIDAAEQVSLTRMRSPHGIVQYGMKG